MKANTTEKWLEERVKKYGPISKLSLFGNTAVFIYGQAANKLVFTSDGRTKVTWIADRCGTRNRNWNAVLPLMKTLTFNIICSLLFGVERGGRRDELVDCFQKMMEDMWSIPINLPFTRYNQSLRASAQAQNIVKELIHEKRDELEKKGASSHQDLITCLLSIHGRDKAAKPKMR
ncbi:beta-amyrin 28-monooxygenase-like [Actinidia eriantha]|uniref:beta-amyrin 28-monooxygenase-like n=1 Tax=Actinidia eriantha TaxID=165200 RepID=UPI00258CAF21|nr:beta-amyrin 28-monooxygenase-like [Actinidia eriantha]